MILSFNFVLIFKRNGWITRISADNISCTIQTVLRDILMVECCPLVPGTRRIIARWGGGCRYGDPADTRPVSCDQPPAHQSIRNYIGHHTAHTMTLTATTAAICLATRKRLPFKSLSATLLQIAMEKLQLNNSLFLICNISHFREQIN